MKLAVIDPGVFAAGVFWRHEPHRCLKAWLKGGLTPVLTEEIFEEYQAVLEQVKQAHRFTTDTEPWLEAIRMTGMWVDGEMIVKTLCHDWRDQRLIEAAVTAKCHTVIVRDRAVTILQNPLGIDLYTPREWLDTLPQTQSRRLRQAVRRGHFNAGSRDGSGCNPLRQDTDNSPTGGQPDHS